MLEYLPARLSFHLLYVLLHEGFESLEVDSLDLRGLVNIIIDHDLLQGCDVFLPQVLIEDLFLQIRQVLIIHDAITVLVTNTEDSQKSLDVVWLELPLDRVVQRRERKEHSLLGCSYNINQINIDLGRAFNSHLHLLELLEVVIEQIRVLVVIGF